MHFLAYGRLLGCQYCYNQFSFAADRESGEPLEPRAHRDDGFMIHPCSHAAEILRCDAPLLDAQQDVIKQRFG